MQALQRGSKGEDVVLTQRALNEQVGANLARDGGFGPAVEAALKKFQAVQGFPVTGAVEGVTRDFLANYIEERFIRISDMDAFAKKMGVAPSSLKAVYKIESKGEGFLMSGDAVILFEGHIFNRMLTQHKGASFASQIRSKYPHICYPSFDQSKYKGGQREHLRLEEAMGIDKQSALQSASWGLFQLMGFNATAVGYADVFEFAEAMDTSEKDQLQAGCNFITSNKAMHQALINKDWAGFARRYNGASYAKNQYDVKLNNAERAYR